MSKQIRDFFTAFIVSLLVWGAVSGIAVVNYQLEFGGFDGFGDRYGVAAPEPLTLVVKTDGIDHHVSLAAINSIVADPFAYVITIPRPLRMLLVAQQTVEQLSSKQEQMQDAILQ